MQFPDQKRLSRTQSLVDALQYLHSEAIKLQHKEVADHLAKSHEAAVRYLSSRHVSITRPGNSGK